MVGEFLVYCLFVSHFSTYGNLRWANAISRLLCSLIMNLCMFLMAPSCVVVGQLANQ